MTEASAFEVKLHGFRKTREGTVISFVVHPEETPKELALADIGQRFGMALVQLRDDEQPNVPQPPKDEARSTEAKVRYATSGSADKAVTRAALLCNDMRFQKWIAEQYGEIGLAEDDAVLRCAARLRFAIKASSRTEIRDDPVIYKRFIAMETTYQQDVGLIAEMRR